MQNGPAPALRNKHFRGAWGAPPIYVFASYSVSFESQVIPQLLQSELAWSKAASCRTIWARLKKFSCYKQFIHSTAFVISEHYTCLLPCLILCQVLFKAVSSSHSWLSAQRRLSLQSWLLCSCLLRFKDLSDRVRVEHSVWELESRWCFWKLSVGLNPRSLLALLNASLLFTVLFNSRCSPNWLSVSCF